MTQVDFIIDRVLSVARLELADNSLGFLAKSVEDPQLEFTGETKEKRDAQGTLIAQFDTSKGVTFSASLSLLSLLVMAAQLGTEVKFASTGNKISIEDVAELAVTNGTATLPFTPKTAPTALYEMNADGSPGTKIEIGAGEGNASIDGKTITMPAGSEATRIAVPYEYESETAVMVEDGSENFTTPAKYIIKILGADVCNPALKRSGKIVFPKAKIDNNFSLNLTTEGTHPFSLTALKDYCDAAAKLCYVVWDEEE